VLGSSAAVVSLAVRVAEAQAKAVRTVLTVLRVRGIAVPDQARAQILAQRDLQVLERWHERAIVASSVAEVLNDAS
jgi:hypothetical protein